MSQKLDPEIVVSVQNALDQKATAEINERLKISAARTSRILSYATTNDSSPGNSSDPNF